MKGILMAGGSGSRLAPLTKVVNKHLLPVFDKPMIFYPLATLMLAGVRQILLVTSPRDRSAFEGLLGSGDRWGVNIEYQTQNSPAGIAEALLIGEKFLAGERCALVLGDNLFVGPLFGRTLKRFGSGDVADVFGVHVANPRAYAVVDLDGRGRPRSLEEKPVSPKSSLAVPGLYFLPPDAPEVARSLSPSPRGELEITDINRIYLGRGQLRVTVVPRGTAWLDTGTFELLAAAGQLVQTLQERFGEQVACLEEVAYRMGYISREQLVALARSAPNPHSGEYLSALSLLEDHELQIRG